MVVSSPYLIIVKLHRDIEHIFIPFRYVIWDIQKTVKARKNPQTKKTQTK